VTAVNPSIGTEAPDPSIDAGRCTATVRRTGERCRRWPTHGTTVCSSHGAAAPQVKRKAAERVAENAARAALAPYSAQCEPVADPLSALLQIAGEIIAFKTYVGGRVAELDAGQWRYNSAVAEQVRGEIQLYERALDRCAKVLGEIARLNLDERMVRLSEQQGNLVVIAFEKLLDALGLDDDEQERALSLAPGILREVGRMAA
jgi:hypothetical protein